MNNRSSIFKGYIKSYMFVISLVYVGVAVLWLCSTFVNLKTIYREENQRRLSLMSSDLAFQIKGMEDISNEIAINHMYRPSYISRNPYYELDMLEDLAKFQGRVYLCENYFILYKDSNTLYHAQGKASFSTYAKSVLGVDDEALLSRLSEVYGTTFLTQASAGEKLLVVAIPVRTMGVRNSAGDIVLVFTVPQNRFIERLSYAAGSIPGDLVLFQQDQLLLGLLPDKESDVQPLTNDVDTTGLSLRLYEDSGSLSIVQSFILKNALLLIAFSLVPLALGIYMAYRNYSPIRKLASTHLNTHSVSDKNELHELDQMLTSTKLAISKARGELAQQQRLQRDALLQIATSGEYSADVEKRLAALGISFISPYFLVIYLKLDTLPADTAHVSSCIESLSDADALFFAARYLGDDQLFVLINLAETEKKDSIPELIASTLEASGVNYQMGVSHLCDSPVRLYAARLNAMDNCRPTLPIIEGDALAHSTHGLQLLSAALNSLDYNKIRICLDQISQQIIAEPSISKRKYMCYDAISTIVQHAHKQQIDFPPETLLQALPIAGEQQFFEAASALVDVICLNAPTSDNQNEAKEPGCVTYINQHFCDPELSLAQISDSLGITPNHISRVVKEYTGENYIQYTTRLRIQKAQELLVTQKIPVAQVCDAVGYSNISYFIKVFKRTTGKTPAAFRRPEDAG